LLDSDDSLPSIEKEYHYSGLSIFGMALVWTALLIACFGFCFGMSGF